MNEVIIKILVGVTGFSFKYKPIGSKWFLKLMSRVRYEWEEEDGRRVSRIRWLGSR